MPRNIGTGCVFKRQLKPKNGKKRFANYYSYYYIDANGKRVDRKGYTDKKATEEKLRKAQKRVAMEAEGLVTPNQESLGKPIMEHVEDFLVQKTHEGNSETEIKKKRSRLTRFIKSVDIERFRNLSERAVTAFFENEKLWTPSMKKDRQWEIASKKTRNEYRALIRLFSSWLAKTYTWPDPLAGLKNERGGDGRRLKRFALTTKQLIALFEAARERGVQKYLETHKNPNPKTVELLRRRGREREVIYRLGARMGLRSNETRTLTWGCLDLKSHIPTCTIRAENAKSRREDTVPINKGLVATLQEWHQFRTKELGRAPMPSELVVHFPRHLRDEQFAKDCEYAGIVMKNDLGEKLDLYAATRHTFCTIMGRQDISAFKMQQLMRHRSLSMTLIYTHLGIEDIHSAANSLDSVPEFKV
jgi:integrase